ncbi:MAG: SUMF1/EgtB/PvdO family nonheme iron enzyme [Alphaproteobacteria bacterium]
MLASLAVGLVVAEVIVRHYDYDWNLLKKLLYYQMSGQEVHQVVDDPDLLYRLKPGAVSDDGLVHINRLGFRGREVDAAKPPGVYRVLVVGGSNVYGMHMTDEQTWPAQLERRLRRYWRGEYEVLNGGVQAYVPTQMARIAEEALDKYDPDLIIYALSNAGAPGLLGGTPIEEFFAKYPQFWARLFHARYPLLSLGENKERRVWLLQRSRLYRFAYAMAMGLTGEGWHTNPAFVAANINASHRLIEKAQHAGVRFGIFLYPGAYEELGQTYAGKYDVPVFKLDGTGLPEKYNEVHPPPHVMIWYAKEISRWLSESGLLGLAWPRPLVDDLPPKVFDDGGAITVRGDVKIKDDEVYLPGSEFQMGCSPGDGECLPDELPRQRMTVAPFWLDRDEVTAGEYRQCVEAGACPPAKLADWLAEQPENHPAAGVTVAQAAQYCAWRGGRLPDEAEWEFAARAGDYAPIYGPPEQVAWFDENSERRAHPVRGKRPNDWGLFDMYGNAWEWCRDHYSPRYIPYAEQQRRSRREGDLPPHAVVRGGGWFTDRSYLRASFRNANYPLSVADRDIGFRCARDVQQPAASD